ncbi:MAG: ABC transporter permease [Paracoccaceae bacterium]|nr:ABC transporter permease [Paracoccaceae bacterium]MDE3120814.1 ABC transporter permease [Paracoccaceae bacterium]MDE3240398.1 ABC transporter permease [Paracoccaceae bacterium]
MLRFLLRRFGTMILTGLCLSFVVFYLTNLKPNLERLAKTQASARMTQSQVHDWLVEHGYGEPVLKRYGEWLGVVPGWTGKNTETGAPMGRCVDPNNPTTKAATYCGILQGTWGYSTVFRSSVSSILSTRLQATGILMLWVLILMIPVSLVVGIVSGMREGSRLDRGLSVASIATTATPEYVSGVVLIVLLSSPMMGLSPVLRHWGLLHGTALFKGSAASALDHVTFANFTLPVVTVALYGTGYIARMTRASMTEVMTAQYIRTARLKGVRFRTVVLKHALRNALIAPFTVIMLQIPWLLNGVVITETLFNYKGFGWTLVQAAEGNDIELLLGCSIVAVVVVLLTQLISDIGYIYLNPRIRIS